jgi:hypothetical protein
VVLSRVGKREPAGKSIALSLSPRLSRPPPAPARPASAQQSAAAGLPVAQRSAGRRRRLMSQTTGTPVDVQPPGRHLSERYSPLPGA